MAPRLLNPAAVIGRGFTKRACACGCPHGSKPRVPCLGRRSGVGPAVVAVPFTVVLKRTAGVTSHVVCWATRRDGRHSGGELWFGGLLGRRGGRGAEGGPDRLGHLQSRFHAAQEQGAGGKGICQR